TGAQASDRADRDGPLLQSLFLYRCHTLPSPPEGTGAHCSASIRLECLFDFRVLRILDQFFAVHLCSGVAPSPRSQDAVAPPMCDGVSASARLFFPSRTCDHQLPVSVCLFRRRRRPSLARGLAPFCHGAEAPCLRHLAMAAHSVHTAVVLRATV